MTKINGCTSHSYSSIMLEIWTILLIASHKEREDDNIVVFTLALYIIVWRLVMETHEFSCL